MISVEFTDYDTNKKIIEDGVITYWFLHYSKSMRIAPPLTITEEEIRLAWG